MKGVNGEEEILRQALAYYEQGDLAAAEHICEEIRPEAPKRAGADHLLGLIAHQGGDSRRAVELIRRAIDREPHHPVWYANLGSVLRSAGRYEEAVQALTRALTMAPEDAGTANNIGSLLSDMGRHHEAIEWYRRAVDMDASDPNPHYNLGHALHRLGRVGEAMISYREVLKLAPDFVDAYVNLGNLLLHRGMVKEAEVIYRQGLTHVSNDHRLLSNLAAAYIMQGRLSEAAGCLKRAIDQKPNFAAAHNNLASIFQRQGLIDQALACYRRSLILDPADRQNYSNFLFALHYDIKCTSVQIRQAAEAYWARHRPDVLPSPPAPRSRSPRRLRIGYVSADFREHSVSYFFSPLLSAHDRQHFEIFCYASVRRPDKITSAIEQACDHWRDILMMDATAAADVVRRDRIDILIDLGGHTAANRLDLFALQPAPVQLTWLGYPGTTGIGPIAFRITDGIADPIGMTEAHYTERLIRLPEIFLCYGPAPGAPEVADLPAKTRGAITFGSFNNLSKINAEVIGAWADILHRVPNSRLLLKARPLADEVVRTRYVNLFSQHGIETERIHMLPRTTTTAEHLACYHQMDIALDAFPYNGTTTTCEALWMGVPVVTCLGDRHSARVGAAILHQVGLDHLAAEDEAGYVETAVRLTGDLAGLSGLRATLRQRMQESPLCDGDGFARRFEGGLEQAWNRAVMKREDELNA